MHKEESGSGMTVKIHAALSENRRMKLGNFCFCGMCFEKLCIAEFFTLFYLIDVLLYV